MFTPATARPNGGSVLSAADEQWRDHDQTRSELVVGSLSLGPNGAMALASGVRGPSQIVFDGTNFFEGISFDASPGFVERVPIDGPPVTLGLAGTSIAVDDECIYASGFAISSVSKFANAQP
jgi:hypothetical protein